MRGYKFETDLSEQQKDLIRKICFTPGEVVIAAAGSELSLGSERAYTVRNVVVGDDHQVMYEFFECEGRFPHNDFDSLEPGFDLPGVVIDFRGDFFVVGLSDQVTAFARAENGIRDGEVYAIADRMTDRAIGKLVHGSPEPAGNDENVCWFGEFRINIDPQGRHCLADIKALDEAGPEMLFAATEAVVNKLGMGAPGSLQDGFVISGMCGVLAVAEGELRLVPVDEEDKDVFEGGPVITLIRDFDEDAQDDYELLNPGTLTGSIYDPEDRMVGSFDLVARADGAYDVIGISWQENASEELLEDVDMAAGARPKAPSLLM